MNTNNTRDSALAGRPATVRTSGTNVTPAIETIPARAGMQEKAVTQAAAVTQATSNIKDDSNSMTTTIA